MTQAERFRGIPLFLLRMIIGLLIVIVALFVLFSILQERLIFYPQRISDKEAEILMKRNSRVEPISLKTHDNLTIRGWFLKNSSSSKSPLILYFGGNAEEVSYLLDYAEKTKGWSWVLINYRGYGLSEGKPSETNLYRDAISLYDYFAKRDDIDKDRIVIMGRSLGTGVATYLAQMRKTSAVILVSPYDSLVSVGKSVFPFLPVNLILRHRFDSLSRAPFITVPLLVLVASDDNIIPVQYSRKLAEKWGAAYSLIIIKGEDHNTIHDNANYWEAIDDFLKIF
jgi:pimeloyl-ACP methyl ester carboxylesterase